MLFKCGAAAVAEARVIPANQAQWESSPAMAKFGEAIREIRRLRERHPDYSYLRTRAIGNLEVDGPNSNADGFPYEHFDDNRPGYGWESFIGKKAFEEHQSYSLEHAIGDLLDACLNRFDLGHYASVGWAGLNSDQRGEVLSIPDQLDGSIEVLMGIDRQRAPHIARQIDANEIIPVSMGTNVQYSDCSICGNRAFWEKDYCPHITQKGRLFSAAAEDIRELLKTGVLRVEWLPWVVPEDRERDMVLGSDLTGMVKALAFEINHGLSFFELSVVANAAYYRGQSLEKVAAANGVKIHLNELKSACDGEIFQEIIRPTGQVVARINNEQFAVRVHIGGDQTNVIPIPTRFLEIANGGGQDMRARLNMGRRPPSKVIASGEGQGGKESTQQKLALAVTAVEVGGWRFVQEKAGVGDGEGSPTLEAGASTADDERVGSSSQSTATAKKGVSALRERVARMRTAGRRGQAPRRRVAFDQAPGEASKNALEEYSISPASDEAEISFNTDSASATDAQIAEERTFDLTLPEGRVGPAGIEDEEIWAKQAMSSDRVPAKTAWIVYRGMKGNEARSTPQWILTFGSLSARAGGMSKPAYVQFCSDGYGLELIQAAKRYGLETVRREVGGTRTPVRRRATRRRARATMLNRRTPSLRRPLRSRASMRRRATPPPDAAEQRKYYSQIFEPEFVDALLARRQRRDLTARRPRAGSDPRTRKVVAENRKMKQLLSRLLHGQQKRVASDKARLAEAIMTRIAQTRPGEFTREEFGDEIVRMAGMPMAALKTLGEYVSKLGATEFFPSTNDPAAAEEEAGIQSDVLRAVSNPDGDSVDVDDAPDDVLMSQEGLGEMDMSPVSEAHLHPGIQRFASVVPQMTSPTEDLQHADGDFVDEVSQLFTTTPKKLAEKGVHVQSHNVYR